MLEVREEQLLKRLIPTFIFKYSESTFHDFLLAPHQNIYISAKQFGNKILITF
jgi:hypothetical protein